MVNFWSVEEAAVSLGRSLKRIGELEEQKTRYDYSYPPHLVDDIKREGQVVRDAIRFLTSTEADD